MRTDSGSHRNDSTGTSIAVPRLLTRSARYSPRACTPGAPRGTRRTARRPSPSTSPRRPAVRRRSLEGRSLPVDSLPELSPDRLTCYRQEVGIRIQPVCVKPCRGALGCVPLPPVRLGVQRPSLCDQRASRADYTTEDAGAASDEAHPDLGSHARNVTGSATLGSPASSSVWAERGVAATTRSRLAQRRSALLVGPCRGHWQLDVAWPVRTAYPYTCVIGQFADLLISSQEDVRSTDHSARDVQRIHRLQLVLHAQPASQSNHGTGCGHGHNR